MLIKKLSPAPQIFLHTVLFIIMLGSIQVKASVGLQTQFNGYIQITNLDTIPNDIFDDITFQVVEEMPRFPGCEGEITLEAKSKCSSRKMLEFIYANINYPEEARKNNIQGTIMIRYVITKTGNLRDIEVVRSIGGGCDEESLKVVQNMPKWIPGKQRGKNVNVQFNLPIKFKLDKKTIKENEKRMKRENKKQ